MFHQNKRREIASSSAQSGISGGDSAVKPFGAQDIQNIESVFYVLVNTSWYYVSVVGETEVYMCLTRVGGDSVWSVDGIYPFYDIVRLILMHPSGEEMVSKGYQLSTRSVF